MGSTKLIFLSLMSDSEKFSREEYEVDKILNKRFHDGKREYLVKWKGYSKNDATWEPVTNLSNAHSII